MDENEIKCFAQNCYYNHRLLWVEKIKYLMSLKDTENLFEVVNIKYKHVACFGCEFDRKMYPIFSEDDCTCLFKLEDIDGITVYACNDPDTIYDYYTDAICNRDLEKAIKYAWEIYYYPKLS